MSDQTCTVVVVDQNGEVFDPMLGVEGTTVRGTQSFCVAFIDRYRSENPDYEADNKVRFDTRCD